MAMGVAVANAILLVTFAEQNRRNGADRFPPARGRGGTLAARTDDEPSHDCG